MKIRYRWKDILTCGLVSAVSVVFALIVCNAL